MSDRYISVVNGPLKGIVKSLGLPAPVELRRFDPADPRHGYLTEPILVVGPAASADPIAELLLGADFEVVRTATPGQRYSAIIGVFTGIDDPSELGPTALAIGAGIKQLARCGRIVTIAEAAGLTPEEAAGTTAAANAARNAVTGITRSLAPEVRVAANSRAVTAVPRAESTVRNWPDT